MTEKRFTLTNPKNAFQEMKCGIDDKTFDKTLTFNEVVDRLNRFQDLSIDDLKQIEQLKKENEQLKEHQRTLEAKIVRLKDRVKTFEKHYSLKDIERYKKMDNCNCIISKRLEE